MVTWVSLASMGVCASCLGIVLVMTINEIRYEENQEVEGEVFRPGKWLWIRAVALLLGLILTGLSICLSLEGGSWEQGLAANVLSDLVTRIRHPKVPLVSVQAYNILIGCYYVAVEDRTFPRIIGVLMVAAGLLGLLAIAFS